MLHKCPEKWYQYTLVALVITIIILLILAGISITTLTGSGLFENARLAEQKSKNAQELEDSILSDYESKIGEYVDSSRDTITIPKDEYEDLKNNTLRYPDFTNQIGEINTAGGSWTATENCFMIAEMGMNSTTGNTPHILIDNIRVLTYSNYSGTNNRSTMTLHIQKGQTISTYNNDVRGTTYDIKFYKLK